MCPKMRRLAIDLVAAFNVTDVRLFKTMIHSVNNTQFGMNGYFDIISLAVLVLRCAQEGKICFTEHEIML